MGNHIAINTNNATVEATYYLGYPAVRVAVEGTEVFFLGDLHKFADEIAKLYPGLIDPRLTTPLVKSVMELRRQLATKKTPRRKKARK